MLDDCERWSVGRDELGGRGDDSRCGEDGGSAVLVDVCVSSAEDCEARSTACVIICAISSSVRRSKTKTLADTSTRQKEMINQ